VSPAHYADLTGEQTRIRVGARTDVGRIREVNEDSFVAEGFVFAVADGMGGHAAGEVASRIGVLTLRDLSSRHPLRPDDVLGTIREANRRILKAATSPETDGMGTTMAGVTVVRTGGADHWCVFNVGDSRVYRLQGNRMSQITHDHSEVRELLDAGLITADEAARHPLRNVITRSLGTDPGPTPDLWVFPPQPGERFVICTDGLSNEVSDRDIMLALRAHDDPQAAADVLVEAALRAGGRDNVTVVVVAVDTDQDDEEEGDTSPRHDLITN
jgi:serine/threonine protein phosphatase PrpC